MRKRLGTTILARSIITYEKGVFILVFFYTLLFYNVPDDAVSEQKYKLWYWEDLQDLKVYKIVSVIGSELYVEEHLRPNIMLRPYLHDIRPL